MVKKMKKGFLMKVMRNIITILAITFMLISNNSFYAMDKRPTAAENVIEIPAEMFIHIIMSILPSNKRLYTLPINEAADLLVDALEKITDDIGWGHFDPKKGAFFTILIKKIQEQKYNTSMLNEAVEQAIKKDLWFITLILIKAGAAIPYNLFYENIQLNNENGVKKFLFLIKKLKELGFTIDFNAIPYYDMDIDKIVKNPLRYILALMEYSEDEQEKDSYKKLLKDILDWAGKNGYLNDILAVDNEKLFTKILNSLFHGKLAFFVADVVRPYNPKLSKRIEKFVYAKHEQAVQKGLPDEERYGW